MGSAQVQGAIRETFATFLNFVIFSTQRSIVYLLCAVLYTVNTWVLFMYLYDQADMLDVPVFLLMHISRGLHLIGC